MTYDSKIASANELVGRHNAAAGEDNKVDFEGFVRELKKIGGTTEDALRACSWEDLESCGLPRLLARAVAEVFRVRDTEHGPRNWITPARAERMAVVELLEAYDQRNSDNSVGKRLAEISKGRRCIVFNDDGTVNQVASLVLVEELRKGFAEREYYTAEGDKPRSVFRVGERLHDIVELDPLFPNEVLRPDGTSTKTGRSWQDIPQKVRVLLLLAREQKELEVHSVADAHPVMDLVDSLLLRERVKVSGAGKSGDSLALGEAFRTLCQRYPKASLRYDHLEQMGKLPALTASLRGQGVPGKDDPFFREGQRNVQT